MLFNIINNRRTKLTIADLRTGDWFMFDNHTSAVHALCTNGYVVNLTTGIYYKPICINDKVIQVDLVCKDIVLVE